ncbi:DNA-binding transcriptional regulator, AcrR family [Amycolatopsis arida]|uniref:DNA-binding transcriptional regulator, AcrR family n=1 Tax=Amycolatopsis arida TaxID=587909 RepID=A0A1I5M2C7_9PSEU|nr:TetR/AcrR family transcriptional regulator [Amycolatopsis arida]TDX93941.1 AcrR family transcriptional regulator [Amycolatopsis arida]SFP03702.1 DNA-binding transcriptional regulator, AcrR family [Amycolatopsis arida]
MRARPRTYGGRSAEQRRADRRRQLVDAATEIWGEQGWAAVTMRGVCARAGLIDRYFYESFTDRDALLAAVWDQQLDEVVLLLLGAIEGSRDEHPLSQLRAAIAAFVHHVTADPRRARIAFGDHAGSAVLQQRRRDALRRMTDLLVEVARPHLAPGVDDTDFRMTTLLGIGGFVELVTAWHAGVVAVDAERLIDHAADVGTVLGARYLRADLLDGPSSR